MQPKELNQELGNIDLYLLDLLLKGYLDANMKILDAGCGEGRNAHWFIKNDYQVYGIDQNPSAIRFVRILAQSLNPHYDTHRFQEGDLSKILFPNTTFQAIICSAVLHFAQSEEHFLQMWAELWRVLTPQGFLFLRMASAEGIETQIQALKNGQYLLPDGSQRFLMTSALWQKINATYQLEILEPMKTVLVHGQRSMNVMVLKKLGS